MVKSHQYRGRRDNSGIFISYMLETPHSGYLDINTNIIRRMFVDNLVFGRTLICFYGLCLLAGQVRLSLCPLY